MSATATTSTSPSAPASARVPGRNGPLALLFNALVVSFMLAPLLIVCVVAFTPENTLTLPRHGLSLRWFKAVFEHPDFVSSFWNSLWLALGSATLSTVLAVPAGLALTRYSFRGRELINALFLSPLIIPHLVLGVALLRLSSLVGAAGSFGFLLLAHALVVTPYVLRLVLASLVGFDRSIEQAALSLGASPWRSFVRVTLPVRMYMYATESIDPLMAAVSALMVGLTAVAMLVLDRLYGLDKVLVGGHR